MIIKIKIATNIEVVLKFGTPVKCKKRVLIVIKEHTKNENIPNNKINLSGRLEKGINDISKNSNINLKLMGCLVLPFLLGALS